MARLNTAGTPSTTRESSLYRERTPYSAQRSSARSSTYPVLSPSPAPSNSDKENQGSAWLQNGTMDKGKGRMLPPEPVNAANGSRGKRRRLGEYNIPLASQTASDNMAVDEMPDLQFYNPDQDPEERRELRRDLRLNHRDFQDRRDELLQPDNNQLLEYIHRSDSLMGKVRQTADATIDSRFLVSATDLALKKSTRMVLGDSSTGIDIDEFVGKCINFMRNGGPLADDEEVPRSTQARQRRRDATVDDEEDEQEDDGDALDWDVFGHMACFPNIKRPAVPSFLLGPLSVQKRARAVTARRPRLQKEAKGPTQRPQSVDPEDIQKAESSNLTNLCINIRAKIEKHIDEAAAAVDQELSELSEDPSPEQIHEVMRKRRISTNEAGNGCVSLFEAAINPHSFAQSVENLFYISFLIRDGSIAVGKDPDGLPVLNPSRSRTIEEQRAQHVSKHQAVFSLDMKTWRTFIRAFDIKEPLIQHREEEQVQLNGRGWYG